MEKQKKPFIIVVDGKSRAVNLVNDKLFTGGINLQLEMLWYDLRHGTNYRQVRNMLVREKRNRAFEARLGLVRTK